MPNPPVYRVVDDGDSTYIQAVRVHAVHKNGDIVLERPFSGMMGVRFKETALGTVFFSSSKAAVEGFRALQLREIERAERHIRGLRQKGAHFLDYTHAGTIQNPRPQILAI